MAASTEQPRIFLTRGSKILGPYSDEQIESFKASGEFAEFFWYWDGSTPAWVPANPPPPLPVLPAAAAAPAPAAALSALSLSTFESFLVVCHDFHHLMSCSLRTVTPRSCLLVSPPPKSGLPTLRKGQKVWLSLLDQDSNRSENVQGEMIELKRESNGNWEYSVRWERIPEILTSRSQS